MKTIILLASLMISSVTFAQEKSVVNFTEFKKEMGSLDQFNENSLGEAEDLTCNGSYSAEYTCGACY